ncbi:MAG TPA: hypothetical protein VHX60_02490 [Acidobacteriaceae bacterium]|jgi:hypothetical protein|nr:hypothetical protein [Acidobacteriaceae bacterium]
MRLNLRRRKLRVGDWIEICGREEILSTLDHNGQLEGMPFMPEMFAFCGQRFQVYRRAHKTCDTAYPVRGRKVHRAVHLDTRCDGSAHGGCQASCLLFWKEAWLKPLGRKPQPPGSTGGFPPPQPARRSGCSDRSVWDATQVASDYHETHGPRYVCQATQLPYATADLEWWDLRQYLEDYFSGNVSLWRLFCGGAYFLALWLSRAGIGLGRPIRWCFDHLHPLWRGVPFPRRRGTVPAGERTPDGSLHLQPGELVRIKPYKEILNTLDVSNRNRGLFFDAEEVPYCGGEYRVQKRVTRILNERTGHMREMKTPSFILDSVICNSRYSECRLFCPRSIYSYWREVWLERVGTTPGLAPAEKEEQLHPMQ